MAIGGVIVPNLAVNDRPRPVSFRSAPGFRFNAKLSGDTAACIAGERVRERHAAHRAVPQGVHHTAAA
jgi:hypothetical protein